MQRMTTSILVVFVATMTACIDEDPGVELPTESTEQQVNGFVHYGNPEIGLVASSTTVASGYCTGTAVAPNVVLTAAHCMGAPNFFLTQTAQDAAPTSYAVRDRWSSPNTDIGLLWLRQPVPWTRPIKQNGTVNSTGLVYGFGGNSCDWDPVNQRWIFNDGVRIKRLAFFTTAANNVINSPLLCPGDSGGPVIDWNDGLIFGVSVTSSGTQPGDFGTFTPTNASTNWGDLQFVIFVWQATSNQGG
jgi:hypothetical protein